MVDIERNEFEAWATMAADDNLKPRIIEKLPDGEYKMQNTFSAWLAWQASRNQSNNVPVALKALNEIRGIVLAASAPDEEKLSQVLKIVVNRDLWALKPASPDDMEIYNNIASNLIKPESTAPQQAIPSGWIPKLGDLVHPSKAVCDKYPEWKPDELLKIVGINYKRSSLAFGKYTDVIDITIVEMANDYGATDGWKLEDVVPAATQSESEGK